MLFPNIVPIIIENETLTELGDVPKLFFDSRGQASVATENGKVVMCETIEEKVKMFIQLHLRTPKGLYEVYGEFGNTYHNYLGNNAIPIQVVAAEIERELREQLSGLNVFERLSNFETERLTIGLKVSFRVILNDGEINISEVIS
jgi:hypothetical protein